MARQKIEVFAIYVVDKCVYIYIYIYDTCNKRLPYQPQPGTVSNQFST